MSRDFDDVCRRSAQNCADDCKDDVSVSVVTSSIEDNNTKCKKKTIHENQVSHQHEPIRGYTVNAMSVIVQSRVEVMY